MKEFVLFFRRDITTEDAQPTESQMAAYMQLWMGWIKEVSEKGQLKGGNHFSINGKVVKLKEVLDGPYKANQESVAGYIVILEKDMDAALRFARKCPILEGKGASVEIRETEAPSQ